MYREQSHSFTLVEIVLVLAIVALLLAVVVPNVGRIPAKYSRAKAVESLQQVFSEASLRARTTGRTIELIIKPAAGTAVTRELKSTPRRKKFDLQEKSNDEKTGVLWSSKTDYSDNIEWVPHGDQSQFKNLRYVFYPNGEASGMDATFNLNNRQYKLSFNHLSGTISVRAINP